MRKKHEVIFQVLLRGILPNIPQDFHNQDFSSNSFRDFFEELYLCFSWDDIIGLFRKNHQKFIKEDSRNRFLQTALAIPLSVFKGIFSIDLLKDFAINSCTLKNISRNSVRYSFKFQNLLKKTEWVSSITIIQKAIHSPVLVQKLLQKYLNIFIGISLQNVQFHTKFNSDSLTNKIGRTSKESSNVNLKLLNYSRKYQEFTVEF